MTSSRALRSVLSLPLPVLVALAFAAASADAGQRGAIRGTLLDPDGKPVVGVEVEMVLAQGGGRAIRVESNDKGEFTRAGLRVGNYRVTIAPDGYEPLQVFVTVESGSQAFINETLHPLPEGVLTQEQSVVANEHLESAQNAFGAGDYAAAAAAFGAFLEMVPNSGPAHFNRAASLERLGDLPAAIASYENAAEHDAGMAGDALVAVGDLHARMEQWRDAVNAFDRAAAISEFDGQTLYRQADYAMRAGDSERAETYFMQARDAAEAEGDAVTLFNYAVYANNAERLDEAVTYFRKAVDANPEFALAFFQLGMSRLRLPEPDQEGAIEALERYLELAPDGSQAVEVRTLLDGLRNPPLD